MPKSDFFIYVFVKKRIKKSPPTTIGLSAGRIKCFLDKYYLGPLEDPPPLLLPLEDEELLLLEELLLDPEE